MPVIVNAIKSSGLLLVTFGTENNSREAVENQLNLGVDGILHNHVYRILEKPI